MEKGTCRILTSFATCNSFTLKTLNSQVLSLQVSWEKVWTVSAYWLHIKIPKFVHFGFKFVFVHFFLFLFFHNTFLNLAGRFINGGNVSCLRLTYLCLSFYCPVSQITCVVILNSCAVPNGFVWYSKLMLHQIMCLFVCLFSTGVLL